MLVSADAVRGRFQSVFCVADRSSQCWHDRDARTYGRAVTTDDFMTAEWMHLPYEVLERANSRITNEVPGTDVLYRMLQVTPGNR